MALKSYNPVTPSLRHSVGIDRSSLWKGGPLKSLTVGCKNAGGRNNLGRITCRHRGGGSKVKYRLLDFKRNNFDIPGIVERIEYDPNRTAFIALVKYSNDEYRYILAPKDLSVGDTVVSGSSADIKVGNCLPISNIPIGTIIHNVELKPGYGGQLVRSAGTWAQIMGKDSGYAQIRLSSGEVRMILLSSMATVGTVSNVDNKNRKIGKAGASRWRGIRPTVRGVAMNPVDHPHGGGEGKTSGGRHPVTPWGKPTKGKKTVRKKSSSKFIIKKRG